MRWFSLLLLILPFFAGDDYVTQVERDREQINKRFADPLESPLGTFAVVLVSKPRTLIGSSPEADAPCQDCGLQPRHAWLVKTSDGFAVDSAEGPVFEVSDSPIPEPGPTTEAPQALPNRAWKVGEKLRMGNVVVALQLHPAGPVLRFIRPDSPQIREFHGLRYFSVDPGCRVRATIEKTPLRSVTVIDTKGWERTAYVYGKLSFELSNRAQRLDLMVFERDPRPDSQFFVMFRDKTSGNESYPAARYLYLPFQPSGETWIDFNYASNPFCAYGDGFACPLPLPGNTLDVPVRAGEKKYFQH